MSFDPSEISFTEVKDLPDELKDDKDKKDKKPKRRLPKYGKGTKYKNAPSRVLNKIIVGTINNTVLKTKKEQLKPEQSEVGEAVMYMIDYYVAIDVDHPALVVFMATMGLAFATFELMEGPDDTVKMRVQASEDLEVSLEEKK